jgi:hypothetical protein
MEVENRGENTQKVVGCTIEGSPKIMDTRHGALRGNFYDVDLV